jgi:micrococcal nuclease
VHIVDGDTLDVTFTETSKRDRIRLIGIDTPESNRPNTPIECFSKKARSALEQLVPVGTAVRVDHDVEARDRYDRFLGYIYRAQDGLFVNLEMARVGMAVPLTFPPNVAHTDEFVAAGDAARSAGVGLWSSCVGPHVPASNEAGP